MSRHTGIAYDTATISSESCVGSGSALVSFKLGLEEEKRRRTCDRAELNVCGALRFGVFDCLLSEVLHLWDSIRISTSVGSLNAGHARSESLKAR